jgi:hypothetical protein
MRYLRGPGWPLLLAAAALYLLLPGHPLAPLPGLPLDAPSLAALGLVAILFFGWAPRRPARADRYLLAALAVLCVVKLGAHAAGLEYGLRADYYTRAADGTIAVEPERSLDYPRLDATRLDRVLGFDAWTIPAYFWNDLRFNFYSWEPSHPSRLGLPLRVRWAGALYAPETGSYGFRLTAQGPASLTIGDAVLSLSDQGSQSTTLALSQGTHPISAEYTRLPDAPVHVEAAWDRGSGYLPLAAPYLLPDDTTPGRWTLAQAAQGVGNVAAVLYVAVLVALAGRLVREWWGRLWVEPVAAPTRRRRRAVEASAGPALVAAELERPLLAAVLLLGLGWAFYVAQAFGQSLNLFNGGEDWLTYESYARDILLNGPLQLEGAPLGGARPYYFQAAYPYFLAALHWLTGESPYGPIVVQLGLLPLEAVLIYYIARRLFGRPAAVVALLLFAAIALLDGQRFATLLLSENLFQLLLPSAVLMLLAALDRPGIGRLVASGALLGALVLARFSALLYLPVAYAVSWGFLARPLGRGRASAMVAVLAAATLGVLALVPLRNGIAAGAPVWMPTSGAVVLFVEHQLPGQVDLGQVESGPLAPLYRAAGLTAANPQAQALEYLRQAPGDYLMSAGRFVAYALGFADLPANAAHQADPAHREFLPIVVLYAIACLAWRETGRAECWLIHGFVLTHLLVLAVFGIVAYPPRTALPLYVLMPVVAGFGAIVAARGLVHARSGLSASAPTASARP